ncbi:CBO0543 family protein [Sutcliffiella deserti]|uniref:CBO0543 family protein n=1 Tax=Sutcliffiella deserti TaxID=2875501 RepID=UPI001CBE2BE6|nr:CBO0543 family protein [Sutcliffiella deserti]
MKLIIMKILNPILPKKFDENEIYTIVVTVLVITVLFVLHKHYRKLTTIELFSVYLFNIFLATTLESLFAEHPLDMYDTMDFAHAEIFDLILQSFTYPASLVIIIHFYKKWKPNLVVFILGTACILTFLEWISLFFNLFQYRGWALYYSFLFYIFIAAINGVFFRGISKVKKRRSTY